MDTEEQASPPDPELLNRQPKWFKPVLYLCIGASVLFAIVLLLVAPPMMRTTNRGYQAEAINNARQIGLALLEFEMDYGYPNGTTVAAVTKRFPAHGFDLTGSSSNALFRQLFAAELTYSELMFYAKTKDCKKPDGIITRGEALKRNEIGFSYIAGLTSTGADPLTPIVLTPLIPGTTKFDPKPFDGKPSSSTSTTPSAPTTSQKTATSTTPKASTSSPPSTPSGKAKPPTSAILNSGEPSFQPAPPTGGNILHAHHFEKSPLRSGFLWG